jgi:hypothetical protein
MSATAKAIQDRTRELRSLLRMRSTTKREAAAARKELAVLASIR